MHDLASCVGHGLANPADLLTGWASNGASNAAHSAIDGTLRVASNDLVANIGRRGTKALQGLACRALHEATSSTDGRSDGSLDVATGNVSANLATHLAYIADDVACISANRVADGTNPIG